jgi:uncharacterized membrane protein YraQ (UPF0718 family)
MGDIFYPVQALADYLTYSLFGLGKTSYFGSALNFFIYDALKIGLLLIAINLLMAVVRYHFPMEKVKNILTKRRLFGLDYLFAALLGVVTPFCSCSGIPLFIGFVGAGIPLGVTFTFLIASPLINEASLYLFPAMFGWKVTVIYNIAGIAVAVLGGMFMQSLHLDKYIRTELLKFKSKNEVEKEHGGKAPPLKELVSYWVRDGWNITKEVYPYVLLGVGIGALIHGFVPASLVEKYLASKELWAVPLAVLLGAPLYANSVSVVPVMEALVGKGVPLGTALAFMTSIVTISIPTFLILRKVMKDRLVWIFFGITMVGMILMGYLINLLV